MKKKLVSLLLALVMVISLCASAGAEKLSTVTVTGNQSYTYAFQVLTLVNQERAKEGLEPLTMDTSLLDTAMLRGAECSILFDSQHTRPDGTPCFTANDLMYGENIAAGYTSPESVMNGWMNSDGHRANILTEGYTTIGIGCVAVDGTLYWVQDFGYEGVEEADPTSYSDCDNTWTITVSDEVVYADRYYIQQGSLIYMVENDEAVVYLCEESASGAITIPASVEGYPVTGIDFAAFAGCEEITSVSIPDSVTSIGYNAFYNCTRLAKVNIPAGVTFVGADAFFETRCFRETYDGETAILDHWILYVSEDLEGSFTVPEDTLGIAEMAVLGCQGITDVTIPGSVKYINDQAFSGCTGLSQITFEGNVPVIGGNAFEGVTAQVTCPYEEDETWCSIDQDYGGSLTWLIPRFLDLPEEAWYTPYANEAADLGLMKGVGGHQFDPMGTTTRAMIVQILYAMEGSPEVEGENPFTDVEADKWYADAIQWAYENQVTSGTSDTTFSPNQPVRREEIARFLYCYYGQPEVTGSLSGFTDSRQVHNWAVSSVIWATQSGIISGYPNGDGSLSLRPLKNATRAEVAKMMVDFCGLVSGDSEEPELAE